MEQDGDLDGLLLWHVQTGLVLESSVIRRRRNGPLFLLGLAWSVSLFGCKTAPSATGPSATPGGEVPASGSIRSSASPAEAASAAPSGPQGPAAPTTVSVAGIGGVQLSLEGCILTSSSPTSTGRIDVGFPEPCWFADSGRGGVQVVRTVQGEAVIVGSSRQRPPRDDGVRDCDTQFRGVVVRDKEAFVSREVQRVASCAAGPLDDTMFHVFAADTIPIRRAPNDGG